MFDARASFNLVTVNTPRLFENKKFVAVAIGLFIGISTMALNLFMGAGRIGKNTLTEQNFGIEFRRSWVDDHDKAIGVVRKFGVPVWENGQGLGSRMPNLMAQQTQSPSIFLGKLLPVENIVIIQNFFVTILALVVLNLTILSWSDWRIYRRLFFMDVAILGPFFLYTLRNDWSIQADQYFALCLIFAGFLNPIWYEDKFSKLYKPSTNLVSVAFVFGLGILLTGHVLFFQIGLFSYAALLILNFRSIQRILGKSVIVMIVVLGLFLTIPQLLELNSQSWRDAYINHSSQPSIFDIFLPKEFWVYRFQPITAFLSAAFQPLLRIVNKAGPRTEFFNLLLIPFILSRFVGDKKLVPVVRRVTKTAMLASGSIFICMVFVGSIARSGLPVVSKLFDFHVWEMSHSLSLLLIVLTTILLGVNQKESDLPNILRSMSSVILSSALMLAVLYPLVMATVQASEEKFINIENKLKENTSKFSPASLGLEKTYRSVFVSDSLFEKLFGNRLKLELQRSGYPLIDHVTYGRSSGSLRNDTEQKFRNAFKPSLADCQAEVLDFLAISAIVSEYTKSSDCRTELSTYFGSETERTIKSAAGDDLAFVNKPKMFSSWSIAQDASSNPTESCPLFEKDCLSGLNVAKLEVESRAPFKLCESECLFTYEWVAPLTSKQVLVPENYDKTIEVLDQITGVKLRTANYQGLLAVSIPSGATGGVFEASIKPDAMMWARVSATYIHTLIWILTVILILIRGLRGRKRPALAETESIDESNSQISH